MQVKIKRIDKTLPLPEYKTAGAAAFDLYSRESCVIPARSIYKIPSNLIIEIPEGMVLILAARSSLAYKKGLMLANGIGTIDSDFHGPSDEILLSVYNFTDKEVVVEKGERIIQGMFLDVNRANWEEVEEMNGKNRDGFGSTGLI